MQQTEFPFSLPHGYVDEGSLYVRDSEGLSFRTRHVDYSDVPRVQSIQHTYRVSLIFGRIVGHSGGIPKCEINSSLIKLGRRVASFRRLFAIDVDDLGDLIGKLVKVHSRVVRQIAARLQ